MFFQEPIISTLTAKCPKPILSFPKKQTYSTFWWQKVGKNHEQDTLLYDFVVKIHNGFNNSLTNHSLKQVSSLYCVFHTHASGSALCSISRQIRAPLALWILNQCIALLNNKILLLLNNPAEPEAMLSLAAKGLGIELLLM